MRELRSRSAYPAAPRARGRWWLLLAASLVFAWTTATRTWPAVRDAPHGRDFASYHYAVQAVAAGLDPYDAETLSSLARAERTRRRVHPYLYPPPFLLAVAWSAPLDLRTARRTWFAVSLGLLGATVAGLLRLVGGGAALPLAALLLGWTPLPDSLRMGQANLLVLALVTWGAVFLARRRPLAGGFLVGAAAMTKVAPGLLAVHWVVARRWRAAGGAALAALVASAAALPLVGWEVERRFWFEVLPGLLSGDFRGLTVPLTLPGNHSLLNLWMWIAPGGPQPTPLAAWGAHVTALALLGGLLMALRRADPLGAPALSAVLALSVVLPAYTWEHHLVLLVLPWTVVGAALLDGRLPRAWGWALAPAFVGHLFPIATLRRVAEGVGGLPGALLLESRLLSVLAVGAACAALARREGGAPGAG